MENQDFQLIITHENGFTYKKNISQTVCDTIVMLVTTGINSSEKEPQISADFHTTQTKSEKSEGITLNKYCKSIKLSNNKERITAIASYLKKFKKSNLISNDIPKLFAEAGFPPPKNLPRDLKDTVGKSWISENPGSKDEYFLAEKGEKYLLDKESK